MKGAIIIIETSMFEPPPRITRSREIVLSFPLSTSGNPGLAKGSWMPAFGAPARALIWPFRVEKGPK
jgi:hypothetical protein